MLRGLLGGYARGRRQTSAATLYLDFLAGLNDSRITYSGGANGTRVNSAGVIVAATTPRFDYNPVTLAARGLLVEEARTNSLRNNSMTGVAAGSPGTPPTNWSVTSTAGLVTRTIVGSGSEAGIAYVDIRYQFSGAGNANLAFEQNTQIAAAIGNAWTDSTYLSLVSGGLTNLSLVFGINELNGAGGFLTGSSAAITPTSAALISQRVAHTRTLTNAATAYASPFIFFTASGAADITLRIGYPQMELGAFATSVIPTTTAAVTRTADSAVMTGTNFSSWYNQSEGTFAVKASSLNVSTYKPLIQIDSSLTERIYLDQNSGAMRLNAVNAGVNDINITLAAVTANTPFTEGATYKVNDYAAALNGAAPVVDTSGLVPVTNTFRIGSDSVNRWNGHIQTIQYFPRRVANTQLQAMTA